MSTSTRHPARVPPSLCTMAFLTVWLLGACSQATGTPDADTDLADASPLPAASAEPAAAASHAAAEAVPALPGLAPTPLPALGAVPIPLPAPPSPAAADDVHVLAAGEDAQIGPAARLRFERVVSDSRCPAGAQCVWEGEVRIAMSLVSPGDSSAFELSKQENRTTVQAFKIEFLSYDACPIDKGGPKQECASVKATAGSK